MRRLGRYLMWLLVLGTVVGLVWYLLLPSPVEVEAAMVTRGPMEVAVREEAETRIKERYVISSPVAGQLARIKLRPGDVLEANETLVASIQPSDPEMLDARQIAETEARVAAAEAMVQRAEAKRDQAKIAMDLAETQFGRAQQLIEKKSISRDEFDSIQADFRSKSEELRVANFESEIAKFELQQAQAALGLTKPSNDGGLEQFEIVSPIDGAVLRVFQESATVVAPGNNLVEIGNTADLEIVIDVLSSDAVKINRGDPVFLEDWGGERPLQGTVRVVEPAAFTKISALGVEEQRVNVIADFLSPSDRLTPLGDRYAGQARIVIWQADDVVRVPASALFRHNGGWAVFVVAERQATLRPVEIGQKNELTAEVRDGLTVGETVIAYPSDMISHGTAVVVKSTGEAG